MEEEWSWGSQGIRPDTKPRQRAQQVQRPEGWKEFGMLQASKTHVAKLH